MKLLSVYSRHGPRLAASVSSGILVFSEVSGRMQDRSLPQTMEELVFRDGGIENARPLLEEAIALAEQSSLVRPASAYRPTRLYQPRSILCVARGRGDQFRIAAQGPRGVFRQEGIFVVELLELAGRAGNRRGRREPFRQCARIRKVVHVPLRERGQLIIECG